MEIKHNESYLYLYKDMKELGFTVRTIMKLHFQGYATDSRSKQAIQDMKDFLEANYKMYQYKKDNGVKFGEHELFYWSNNNSDPLYFTIDFNEKRSFAENDMLAKKIIEYVETTYSHIEGYLSIQYKDATDWAKVNDYVENTEFDIRNLPFKVLSLFYANICYVGNQLSPKSIEILHSLEKQLFESLIDKKVVFNEIKGTLKEIQKGVYGVFKPRSSKTYYSINLGKIKTLQAV
jgi:hypothetical protein